MPKTFHASEEKGFVCSAKLSRARNGLGVSFVQLIHRPSASGRTDGRTEEGGKNLLNLNKMKWVPHRSFQFSIQQSVSAPVCIRRNFSIRRRCSRLMAEQNPLPPWRLSLLTRTNNNNNNIRSPFEAATKFIHNPRSRIFNPIVFGWNRWSRCRCLPRTRLAAAGPHKNQCSNIKYLIIDDALIFYAFSPIRKKRNFFFPVGKNVRFFTFFSCAFRFYVSGLFRTNIHFIALQEIPTSTFRLAFRCFSFHNHVQYQSMASTYAFTFPLSLLPRASSGSFHHPNWQNEMISDRRI